MTKSRFLLLLFIVVFSVLLYLLPRYVVNNINLDIEDNTSDNTDNTIESHQQAETGSHSFQMFDSMSAVI